MRFEYEAWNPKLGKVQKGKVTTESRQEALHSLQQQGLKVYTLKPSRSWLQLNQTIWIGRPVTHVEFVIFCRQLATLIDAEVPLVDSLRLQIDQAKSLPFKKALQQIYQDVRSGQSLSKACSHFPKIFTKVFISMIRAGETSGELAEVLQRLAVLYEKNYHTREKVKSALSYPIIICVVATVVVTFLLTRVIPTFIQQLQNAGGELPYPTAVLLAISDIIRNYWYIHLSLLLLLIISYFLIARTPQGRYYIDHIKLKIPVFGVLIQKNSMANMSRILATLFASSVPVLQAMTIASQVVGNEVIAKPIQDACEALKGGRKLSQPLAQSWVFPKLVTHMIAVGEETGKLDTMLTKIADFYEAEVEHMATRLNAIIEPILIAVLAIVVGGILLAALLPMFEIYNRV